MSATFPKVVLVLSGKRKSGKDYIASIVEKQVPSVAILRNAGPIKSQFAKIHGLDTEKLLDASEYKETYRKQMVEWSENIRKSDPHYFLRISIDENDGYKKPFWMMTDARRESDLQFFRSEQFKNVKVFAVRVVASDEARTNRGWAYTAGIDDKETECGLDKHTAWDIIVNNDNLSPEQVLQCLDPVMQAVKVALNC